jgi:hypothetical protein
MKYLVFLVIGRGPLEKIIQVYTVKSSRNSTNVGRGSVA